MEEDIQLTSELLDEIVKEAYKKGVEDAQGRKERRDADTGFAYPAPAQEARLERPHPDGVPHRLPAGGGA